MNITTRRFPRTLAEAFPDSWEASIAKAHYGCALTIYRSELVPTHVSAGFVVAMLISFLLGVGVTALVLA